MPRGGERNRPHACQPPCRDRHLTFRPGRLRNPYDVRAATTRTERTICARNCLHGSLFILRAESAIRRWDRIALLLHYVINPARRLTTNNPFGAGIWHQA